MNKLMTLITAFESLKMTTNSKMHDMLDIKMNIASEHYSLAASQVRQNIQSIQMRTPSITDKDHGIQMLQMIHNVIIDKEYEHHKDYFESLFELIHSNLSQADLLDNYAILKSFGNDLHSAKSREIFIDAGKKLNKKEFKHKEATMFFVAQLLAVHDHLNSLGAKYL